MSQPTATRLLSLSSRAVSRAAWLTVPMVVGEALTTLLALVPAYLLVARALVNARRFEAFDEGAFALGLFTSIVEPGLLAVLSVGGLLAAVGAFLVRSLVHAGAVKTLSAAQAGGDTDESFARGVLEEPARWLLTAVFVVVLRVAALGSALGMVVVGMVRFQTAPGAGAALLMTIATAALVVQPLLHAALELAFVRSVLLPEGPVRAVGGALEQAWHRSSALVPAWATCVLIELVVTFAGAIASGIVEVAGVDERIRLQVLGPRVAVWVGVAAVSALVTLWRLGDSAALVGSDAGWLPEPAPPVRPPPPPAPVEVPAPPQESPGAV